MANRLMPLFTALSLAVLTGCNLLPPTAPAEISTRVGADGRVRQFFVSPQSSGTVPLGTARNLLIALSTGAVASRAESFRIQAPDPSSADPSEPHGRFRESSRAIAREAAWDPAYRVQDVELPPKLGDPPRPFWVNTGNSLLSGDRQQMAKLVGQPTANAYFFVDTQSSLNDDPAFMQAKIAELANAFETVIVPRVTQIFGMPPSPGIDGDPRIYVVLSPAVDNFGEDAGLMGYFWSRDLYPPQPGTVRQNSNQKEVIFLTDKIFKQKPWTVYGTLAHEFTHLVIYNQKVLAPGRTTPEETWLDEGLAMLAMDLCGYGLRHGNDEVAKDIDRFQTAPEKYSLTDWFRNPSGFSYGLSYLFTRYLYDRFGEGAIRDLMRSPYVGIAALDQTLGPRSLSFEQLFSDWSLANAISGLNLTQDPRYSYAPEINLRGKYGDVQLKGIQARPLSGPADVTAPNRPWATAYYLLGASQERTWTMDVRPGFGLFGGTVVLP